MKAATFRECFRILFATCLLASGAPASADITYNYEQQWLFDSESGLYWQFAGIPASTFVPGYGTLATGIELNGLFGHVDAAVATGSPGQYSLPMANLLSFLATNSPARSAALQPDLNVSVMYWLPGLGLPDAPDRDHEYLYLGYREIDPRSSTWQFDTVTTIGTYGPGFPCPTYDHVGLGCPDLVKGLVYSTAPPPVPVPAAIWLMASGMGSLLALGRARRNRRAA